jgi:putative ubiquitin-RnfH superfamily antitoxin RatB of RatAB toxin-antitoxin module
MTLRVSVALALPDRQEVVALELAEGATVADALAAARVAERMPGYADGRLAVGVWSRRCDPSTRLRDGDRVEVYRPLQADPKDSRRRRAASSSSTRSRSGR